MQILCKLLGQRPRLERWERQRFSRGVTAGPRRRDNHAFYQREVGKEAPGQPEPDGPFCRVAEAILRYDIFPPGLVTGVLRRTPVEVGDTVGICYHFLPGLDLFFAAQVIERFDGPQGNVWRAGFTYRTVRGHPVAGEETFAVEKDLASGGILASLRSWSRPGLLLTSPGGCSPA
jgi:hypothetical protein